MSEREAIHSDGAPRAVGPYVQAVRSGDLLMTAGQIALDPATGKLVEGDVAAQTERVLANLGAVLAAAGCGFEDVLKCTVFLTTMEDYAAMNEVYGRVFGAVPPARSAVAVLALPLGARVEIECVARVPETPQP